MKCTRNGVPAFRLRFQGLDRDQFVYCNSARDGQHKAYDLVQGQVFMATRVESRNSTLRLLGRTTKTPSYVAGNWVWV